MKFVIAPDSFKGSLSALQVCQTIAQTLSFYFPQGEFILVPMADGGEGTIECLLGEKDKRIQAVVSDPLGSPIEANYGILSDGKTAVIETAQASGLTRLTPEERSPLDTSTQGTGELILNALDQGCRQFIVALGGSATCDGGLGALSALGVVFKGIGFNPLPPIGRSLAEVNEIDLTSMDPRIKDCKFTLAYDVDNLLLGLNGALMYAPQKGATPKDLEILHKGYEQWAYMLEKTTGKRVHEIPGSGAAGGLGAGLAAFTQAKWTSGAELLGQQTQLAKKIQGASLVITGEGRIDAQTLHGKIPYYVTKMAKSEGVPVIAIAGGLNEGFEALYSQGIEAIFTLPWGPMTKKECIRLAKPLLINTTNNIARLMKLRIL